MFSLVEGLVWKINCPSDVDEQQRHAGCPMPFTGAIYEADVAKK